jgi:hypothetical protein
MTRWHCGIEGDDATFDRVEDLVVHQATAHDDVECGVCGAVVPDGYLGIRHLLADHSREAYTEAHGVDPDQADRRASVRETVEAAADLGEIVERLEG